MLGMTLSGGHVAQIDRTSLSRTLNSGSTKILGGFHPEKRKRKQFKMCLFSSRKIFNFKPSTFGSKTFPTAARFRVLVVIIRSPFKSQW